MPTWKPYWPSRCSSGPARSLQPRWTSYGNLG